MASHWDTAEIPTCAATASPEQLAARMRQLIDQRARDEADARLLRDALGLDAEMAPAKSNVVAYAHGTRSGVEHHRAAGVGLCRPCKRWVEVNERAEPGAAQLCGDAVGTVQGYWRHRSGARRQVACERCMEANREYRREYLADKRARG